MSLTRRGLAAALLVCASGCVIHRDRNAPGVADVLQPPSSTPSAPRVRRVSDPGEARLVFLPGAAGGVTGRFTGDRSEVAGSLSVEATVLYGTSRRSHSKPTLLPAVPLLPTRGFGGTLGAVVYQSSPGGLGPLYLEGQYSFWNGVASASAGYAVDLVGEDKAHGPQLSLSFVGLYLRSSFLFGRGTELMLGMVLKLPVTVVWSL